MSTGARWLLGALLLLVMSVGWADPAETSERDSGVRTVQLRSDVGCWWEPKPDDVPEQICGATDLAPPDAYGFTAYPVNIRNGHGASSDTSQVSDSSQHR